MRNNVPMLNRLAPQNVRAIAAATILASAAGIANAQLRVVTWNISVYNGGRVADIQTVCYGTNPANGLSMRPDIILAQEFVSASALTTFVSALNTAPGSPPVGVFLDFASFFWAEAIVEISLVALVVFYLTGDRAAPGTDDAPADTNAAAEVDAGDGDREGAPTAPAAPSAP